MKRKKEIVVSELMTPSTANMLGNVHGGYLLGLLDRVAYACAARYCGLTLVTLSVDQVFFKEPIYVGELVSCYATVNYVGKTSIEVGIRVEAENLQTGKIRHTNTCYFTMVAIDENSKPIPIPPLEVKTDEEKRHFKDAEERKAFRLKLYKDKKSRS